MNRARLGAVGASIAIKWRVPVHYYWNWRLASLGRGGKIALSVKIYRPARVKIGADCFINDFVHIWGGGGVDIGEGTMIAAHSVITSQTHDVDAARKGQLYWKTNQHAPVLIGRNVWIGSNVTILPGVSIGDDSVIAAGAVVVSSVPCRALYGGIPAKLIREL